MVDRSTSNEGTGVTDGELRERSGGPTVPLRTASLSVKRRLFDAIPDRYGAAAESALHRVGVGLSIAVLLIAAFVFLTDVVSVLVRAVLGGEVFGGEYTFAVRVLGFITLALAWDIVGGQMGYVSFGNFAFFGIGVYVAVVMLNGTVGWIGTHPLWVVVIASALACVAYAVLLGLALFRLRGAYFGIATIGVLVATMEYAANVEATGGGHGIVIPQTGYSNINRTFFFLFFALTVVTFVTYWFLMNRSRFGFGLNAIRDDEGKARAMGLHTTKYKIFDWSISALFYGVTGVLFAVHNSYVNPTVAFNLDWTILSILMVLVGGIGRLWGPVVGALFLWWIRDFLWSNPPIVERTSQLIGVPLNEAYLVVFGVVLVLVVIGAPEGVLGYLDEHDVFDPVRRRVRETPARRVVGIGGDQR